MANVNINITTLVGPSTYSAFDANNVPAGSQYWVPIHGGYIYTRPGWVTAFIPANELEASLAAAKASGLTIVQS